MVDTQYNGMLYFNDQYGKFADNKNSAKRYTQNNDIRIGTQSKIDGSPLALTVEVADAGKLALDEDTFQKEGNPKLSAKVNYNGIKNEEFPSVVRTLVDLFKAKKYKQQKETYVAVDNSMPYSISKDEYHSIDYKF